MHTQDNNDHRSNANNEQTGNVGRAIVAWLIAAALAVTFAAVVSFEAQAAPFGTMPLEIVIEHDSEFLLLGLAAAAIVAVIFIMWRDVIRQADRTLRERNRY